MQQFRLLIVLLLSSMFVNAQNVTGDWYGTLNIQGNKLRLVLHIKETNGKLTSTMDSPDQGAKGIPIQEVDFNNSKLTVKSKTIGFEYSGKVNKSFTEIEGTFKQSGKTFNLKLLRQPEKIVPPKRPQEPKAPFPYYTEDVKFYNSEDNINLAGTLTLPDTTGKYPAVVLISGSGPQNRNSEVFGHKIFLVLADYLTRHGIGVLRFDDRGIGESEGNFSEATSVNFAFDALAGVQYLQSHKNIYNNKIGLLGMSEGGMIAPIAAKLSDDIAFIVLLAGPGIPIPELLKLQQIAISKVNGIPEKAINFNVNLMQGAYKILNKYPNDNNIKIKLETYFKNELKKLSADELKKIGNTDMFIKQTVRTLTTPWFRYFITYKPAENLSKIKCPVLALNGEKDLQVLPKENLNGIEQALKKGGNTNYKIEKLSGLNHLMQKCKTGNPNEYAKIEETMNPAVLKIITEWILNIVKP